MVSVTKKYSNGRFSFVYSESGEEKGECFFSPQTAEILEIKEYSNLSFQERKTLILAVLNHLEPVSYTHLLLTLPICLTKSIFLMIG